MEKVIAGITVRSTKKVISPIFPNGIKQIGTELAQEASIDMTPRHWEVITYLQKEFKNDVPLSIRKIGKSGVVDIKEFYQLFPWRR
jgi:sulfur relay (sulfurtransferase) DsrC/TusE family protein